MESVVNKPYVLVYFNTDNPSENQLDSNFLKQLYAIVDDRYDTHWAVVTQAVVWLVLKILLEKLDVVFIR